MKSMIFVYRRARLVAMCVRPSIYPFVSARLPQKEFTRNLIFGLSKKIF